MTKKPPFLPFFTRFYTVFSQNRKIPKGGGGEITFCIYQITYVHLTNQIFY